MADEQNAYVILEQNDFERARLNSQFWYCHKHINLDRFIHDERLSLPSDAVVLESGAGTGIWSMELAKLMPSSVTFNVIDISTKLFPSTSIVPANVHFSQTSILSLPTEWSSRFDLASQKLLSPALTRHQWRLAVSEFYRVIKPGGHIQLMEFIWSEWTLSKGPANDRFKSVFRELYQKHDLVANVATELPELLKEVGFSDIMVESRSAPVGVGLGPEGEKGMRVFKNVLTSLKPAVLKLGIVSSEKQYDDIFHSIDEDWRNGLGGEFTMLCAIYAQKPVE
ncbi:S-adenosyl-L-methionine-dependent methyltransferase [Lentinula aciculospora]|uniref:S-adenosyl-L-methionine-dependent methyltransferase n=1 Tax=Lentinula aciculospora TaxID=153920 RepID=A0A9W9A2H6_9AGAR|nr:S-adenosyl-L-methionine-dependent methyltransferase [Lentinula aciculospora]